MVRRRRSYDRYGKADGEVTYNEYNAAGCAAVVPSAPPWSVVIDPCHDRDSIPPFRFGASRDVCGARKDGSNSDVREKKSERG